MADRTSHSSIETCKLCYGKSFSSQLMGDTQVPEILFYKCPRGQDLKKLIELNYIPRKQVTIGINAFMVEGHGGGNWRRLVTMLEERIAKVRI